MPQPLIAGLAALAAALAALAPAALAAPPAPAPAASGAVVRAPISPVVITTWDYQYAVAKGRPVIGPSREVPHADWLILGQSRRAGLATIRGQTKCLV